jgi:hemolysin activation/secretion protein
LRAGTLPGTVDVQLDVEDRNPVTWNVELNNRQSANTTQTRLGGTIRYDNLWQLGHSLTISTQLAPERIEDARVLSGTYVFPYDSVGNTATVYVVASRSQFATLSGAPGLGLIGNSDTLGMRFNTKLDSGAGYRYVASFGADYKDLRQTLLSNSDGSILSATPVRYVPLVGNLNASYFGETSRMSLDGTATLGLRGIFSDSDAAFSARRSGTTASFLSLRSNLNYLQTFGRWAAVGRVTAQMAAQPLLPSEQLIAGGADTVRGYLEGERAGDYGLSGSLELRSPSLSWRKGQPDWFVDGKAFIDVAKVATMVTTTPGVSYSLASAGVGLRWNGPAGVSLNAELAHAFVNGSVTVNGDNRLHFSLIGAF